MKRQFLVSWTYHRIWEEVSAKVRTSGSPMFGALQPTGDVPSCKARRRRLHVPSSASEIWATCRAFLASKALPVPDSLMTRRDSAESHTDVAASLPNIFEADVNGMNRARAAGAAARLIFCVVHDRQSGQVLADMVSGEEMDIAVRFEHRLAHFETGFSDKHPVGLESDSHLAPDQVR